MEKEDIQKLRDLPIESVAGRLGLTVERHRCLCPYHDDTHPSLTFNVSKNRFKCYSCDAHGGVIDLAMRVLNKNFVDACHWLADEANVNELVSCDSYNSCPKEKRHFDVSKYARYFEHPFINQLAGQFLFNQRKLHPAVIQWCRLTSWREWLQIPYFDINGKLTGVQWRNLGSSGPRFKFPYGSQCHIYNLPVLRLLRPGEELYIAEGCSDCWSLLSSGHKAIAIPSATLLNVNETGILKGLNLQMFPDADVPGEKLYYQLNNISPVIRHSLPAGCKDYSDYYLSNLAS